MLSRRLIGFSSACHLYFSNGSHQVTQLFDSAEDSPISSGEGRNTKTKVVSRLNERHRLLAESRPPPVTYEWEKELWAKRARFGNYGLASGIAPAELWPTVEEIMEERTVGWYRKYSDILKIAENAKTEERVTAISRMNEVNHAESKYPEMLEEFLASQKEVVPAKTKQELDVEQQTNDMLEYYGYEIAPKDPRFLILFDKMTEAKKKAAKLAEKEEQSQRKVACRRKGRIKEEKPVYDA